MQNKITNLKSQITNNEGFTLVETIVYIAIASIFLWGALGFFWQLKQAEAKGDVMREVKENTAQAVEQFRQTVRNAEEVNEGASSFGADPGALSLVYAGGSRVFDTYTKNITVGGAPITIRKLRLTYGGESYDLTSDQVEIDQFLLANVTQASGPDAVRLAFQLSSVNPGGDPDYDASLAVQMTAQVRQEL